MGTRARIVLFSEQEEDAARAASEAFEAIEQLEQTLSDYRPASDIRRLQDHTAVGEWAAISPLLFTNLENSLRLGAQTGQAFSVTVGPIVTLWRRARRDGITPTDDEIATAREASVPTYLELDPQRTAARMTHPGMRFDFGGIGKGQAAHAARTALQRTGHPACLIDLGGDIALGSPPPGRAGWAITVSTGRATATRHTLHDTCIATSGDAEQWSHIEGVRYSHIVDPRTGCALVSGVAATVIHPDGATADALASAACVVGASGLHTLRESFPEASITLWGGIAGPPDR